MILKEDNATIICYNPPTPPPFFSFFFLSFKEKLKIKKDWFWLGGVGWTIGEWGLCCGVRE